MSVEEFFDLFEKELKSNPELTGYHRLVNSAKMYEFRRAYMEQRMRFVARWIGDEPAKIWDVGCGFGTTAFFLALNGHKVVGTTLEYYYEGISKRRKYWEQFGDLSSLEFEYKNIFSEEHEAENYDFIVAQDTLHHLEPFAEAVKIFHKVLRPGGKIVVSEENGSNVFTRIRHIKERGFKRIVEVYDEKLDEHLLLGNENTRSLRKWKKEFSIMPFEFDEDSIEYIRYFFPGKYRSTEREKVIAEEQRIWRKNTVKREYFFFGMNFVIDKRGGSAE